MRYPGGKGKCFQHIVNILPPHSTYIETHLGGGSVLLNKAPATENIGIDRDPRVIRFWKKNFPDIANFIETDAIDFLEASSFQGDELVYCDPPYLPRTRRRQKVYRFDYTENDHVVLLNRLRALPCFVVISGYQSELYDNLLGGWNSLLLRHTKACALNGSGSTSTCPSVFMMQLIWVQTSVKDR
jgi:DNA adenine methylase